MTKLCKCGQYVKDRCLKCYPITHQRTTKERGYDSRWQKLSARKRMLDPLCERCQQSNKVTPATEVHHIEPIHARPDLRLEWSNLMSVCRECHEAMEGSYVAR